MEIEMNCKTIAQQDLHEKYALGRLAGAQRTEYEAHLLSCPSCQSESQQELTFITGLKDFGRAKMKEEIREQVAILENRGSGWTWGPAMKLAAAVVFLVMTPTLYFIFRTSLSYEMAGTSILERQSQPVREQAAPQAVTESPSKKSKTQAEGVRFKIRKQARQGLTGEQEQTRVGAPTPVEEKAGATSEPIRRASLLLRDNDSVVVTSGAYALAEPDEPELPSPEQEFEDLSLRVLALEAGRSQPKPDLAKQMAAERLDARRDESAPPRESRQIAPTLMSEGDLYVYQRPRPATEGFVASSKGAPREWRFVWKEKVIVANFMPARETRPGLTKLDESGFEVHLVELDSTRIVMNWNVSPQLLTDMPGRMTIEALDKRLVVRVAEGGKYDISLLKPDSWAVLAHDR